MTDFVEIPREIIRIITERKHLDDAVDANIRKGMSQLDAYNEVWIQVDYWLPGFTMYASSESYWRCRNRETRKLLRK